MKMWKSVFALKGSTRRISFLFQEGNEQSTERDFIEKCFTTDSQIKIKKYKNTELPEVKSSNSTLICTYMFKFGLAD